MRLLVMCLFWLVPCMLHIHSDSCCLRASANANANANANDGLQRLIVQLCASCYSALAYCSRIVMSCANTRRTTHFNQQVFNSAGLTNPDRVYLAVEYTTA